MSKKFRRVDTLVTHARAACVQRIRIHRCRALPSPCDHRNNDEQRRLAGNILIFDITTIVVISRAIPFANVLFAKLPETRGIVRFNRIIQRRCIIVTTIYP